MKSKRSLVCLIMQVYLFFVVHALLIPKCFCHGLNVYPAALFFVPFLTFLFFSSFFFKSSFACMTFLGLPPF